ncbi:MAG: PHB depolymerase family esterase [Polyangiaceae bacterium]
MKRRLLASGLFCLAVLACGSSDESALHGPAKDAGMDGSAGMGAAAGQAGGASAGAGGQGGTAASSTGGGAGAPEGGAGGTPATCSVAALPAGTTTITVKSSGQDRSARMVIPKSYDASKPVPLVLVFHGYTESATAIENISQMTPVAEKAGVIVVYPQGILNAWNAGKCCGVASTSNRPDVQFVVDLLDSLEQQLCIDKKRIYAAGFSNGGMLSNRLACELSTRFAAIGPVAGPLAIDACAPQRPMPMIEFHGTGDFVVPYDGGGLSGAKSVKENVDFWQKNAWCTDGTPGETYKKGDVTCASYSQCKEGAAVELCTVEGGGHQWPGGKSAGPGGKLTQDVNGSQRMLDFFLAHPMP